ncbi:hypothetical protein E4413_12060 [Leptospira interrogans]|uniref:hypothetical protein n=2 Tax=Leptospira interrogans TaxID=173 RepID=UPI0002BB7E06|nr:hypothetical protein [Leptospira interrogans]MCR8648272.1 hypothetical protein [Leptospira interrogans serovar Bataviae]OAM75527.1 hypothetical protein A1343_07075 [Leptospira interrogans serovar Bataviae]QCO41565.1 hypothetical protein E4413_12060 [Leptospira interrogans]QOI38051.1 hypothetical protein Lepto1548_06995 [Leptospira interrogans serovar Bataviae]QYY61613.1 hypothetical protein GR153_006470 [Leptospira interrogans serovar Bataviae]
MKWGRWIMEFNEKFTAEQVLAYVVFEIRCLLSSYVRNENTKLELRQAADLAYAFHNDALAIIEGKSFDVKEAIEKIKEIDKILNSRFSENLTSMMNNTISPDKNN